jgi:alkylhydroperoxidase/carboxymuconolactone decarboxylase family protein YurZ
VTSRVRQVPLWACIAAAAAMFATAAAVERAMGRKLWGISGQPGVWSGNVQSEHNSQYMFDPYAFSHVTHKMLFYGLLWLIAGKLPARVRILIAIAIEAAWEMVENTDFVIQRYRAATISLHYYGDSIMNSMCDVLSCVAGLILARLLPARVSIVLAVLLEVFLSLWIRDNLALNILMLIHPIQAIRTWQAGV